MRARLATIKPRVPVVSASHGGKPGHYLDGLVIEADIKNIRSGPALDVLAKLEHERPKFASVTGLTTLGVGEQQAVSFREGEARPVSLVQGAKSAPKRVLTCKRTP